MLRCVAHNVLQRARAPPAGSQGEVQGHQVSARGQASTGQASTRPLSKC